MLSLAVQKISFYLQGYFSDLTSERIDCQPEINKFLSFFNINAWNCSLSNKMTRFTLFYPFPPTTCPLKWKIYNLRRVEKDQEPTIRRKFTWECRCSSRGPLGRLPCPSWLSCLSQDSVIPCNLTKAWGNPWNAACSLPPVRAWSEADRFRRCFLPKRSCVSISRSLTPSHHCLTNLLAISGNEASRYGWLMCWSPTWAFWIWRIRSLPSDG